MNRCTMVFIILMGVVPLQARALSPYQNWAVKQSALSAYAYETHFNNGVRFYKDNVRYAFTEVFQAVIWQESSFCKHKHGLDKKSFGCGQLQLQTAIGVSGVAALTPDLLRKNDKLNMNIAARYLAQCISEFGLDRGLVCYNRGPYKAKRMTLPDVEDDAYVNAVGRHLRDMGLLPLSKD